CIGWQRESSVRTCDSHGAPSPLRTKRRHRRSGPPRLRPRPRQTGPEESSVLRGPGDEVVHPCGPGPRVRVSNPSYHLPLSSADYLGFRRVLQVQCCSDPESPRSVPVGVPSVRRAVSTTARSFVPFPLYLASRTLVDDEHPLVWRVVHRQSRPGRGEVDTGGVHGEATVTNGALSVGPVGVGSPNVVQRVPPIITLLASKQRKAKNLTRRVHLRLRGSEPPIEGNAIRHRMAAQALPWKRRVVRRKFRKEQRHAGGDARRDVDTTPKRTENRKNSKKSESVAETSSSPGESDTRRSKKSALSQASSISDGGKTARF
ncbi:unnamed protein product, partial [Trichogramma brassicae]